MHQKSTIHIAVISDEGYAIPTITMLTSARYNKSPERSYIIHVLGNNLSEFSKRKFRELERPDFSLRFYSCSSERYKHCYIPQGTSFNHSTMIKCELAELLPQLDKVLFLDGDILVMGDLGELYDIDLGSNVLAAMRELRGERKKLHKIIGTTHYFNAGVMLLNLKQMREEKLGEKIIQLKQQAPDTWCYGEQDPFNVVCEGRTHYLHPRWNFFSSAYHALNTMYCSATNEWTIEEFNAFYHTSYANYTEMEEDAVIHHFAWLKPWKNKNMRHAALWQKYHDISPMGNTSLEHIENYPPSPPPPSHFKHDIRLLGILPFLRVKSTPKAISVRLLGLPIIKITKGAKISRLLLFSFLPLLSKKTRES